MRQRVLAVLFGEPDRTLYTPADWAKRLRSDNAFITRVGQQPKIWLVGSEEQIDAIST